MTRLHFILIAVLVAGCSMKENEEELDQGTFLGRHADALEGVDLSWRPDDEISINGHLYVTETGGKEARFIPPHIRQICPLTGRKHTERSLKYNCRSQKVISSTMHLPLSQNPQEEC